MTALGANLLFSEGRMEKEEGQIILLESVFVS